MIFDDVSGFDQLTLEEIEQRFGPSDFKSSSIRPSIRSALMIHAATPRHLNKLDSLTTDCAMINLEDGVSPELKPYAMRLVALFLSHLQNSFSRIVIRINPMDEGGREEIGYLNAFPFHAYRIPKVMSVAEVEEALHLADGKKEIELSIETKEALHLLLELKVDSRVVRTYLGVMDLLESMNLPHSLIHPDNPTIDYILSKFLVESKTAGFDPLGFVYQNHRDLEGFRQWCEKEKAMGFRGKGCIAPKQVEVAHEVFGMDAAQIKRAETIKALFEAKQAEGITGFDHPDLGYIDEPVYKDALVVLQSL